MGEAFEGWAIVELMGHRRLAGHVTEQEIAGAAFLRLDVHGETGEAIVTQFYAPGAVYCITPTTEDIARRLGARSAPAPVSRYELEPPKPRESERDDEFATGDGSPVHHRACMNPDCEGECNG